MAATVTQLIVLSMDPELIETVRNMFLNPPVDLIITASSPQEAESRLIAGRDNILLLDIDQTPADLFFLKRIMTGTNTKTIVTSVSHIKTRVYLDAVVQFFVMKPSAFNPVTRLQFAEGVRSCIKDNAAKPVASMPIQQRFSMLTPQDTKLWAIAASTGGPEALEKIFMALPADLPPTVVVQHMPSGFTKLFSERLNKLCPMEIREAKSGDYLMKGLVLMAPADSHMIVTTQGGKLAVNCFIGTKIHGVMPAADVLFESVAEVMQAKAIGVVLTGMGNDGAKGLMQMHQKGAKTIGQSKETCVVYGMPKAAKDLGAVDYELPLDQIASRLMTL